MFIQFAEYKVNMQKLFMLLYSEKKWKSKLKQEHKTVSTKTYLWEIRIL